MRRKTTAVRIGNVVLSSEEPVLVQSMLNTSTREVDACVEQAIRIGPTSSVGASFQRRKSK